MTGYAQLERVARDAVRSAPETIRQRLLQAVTLEGLQEIVNDDEDLIRSAGRERLIDQLLAVLHGSYVFLEPSALARRTDPVIELLSLRSRCCGRTNGDDALSNWEFFEKISEILEATPDLHTYFILPSSVSKYIGFVPFLIESYFDRNSGRARFFISHLLAGFESDRIRIGDEVVCWQGEHIERVYERRSRGAVFRDLSRIDRRRLDLLTVSPIQASLPGDKNVLKLHLRRGRDQVFEYEHMYLFTEMHPGQLTGDGAGLAVDRSSIVRSTLASTQGSAPGSLAAVPQGSVARRVSLAKQSLFQTHGAVGNRSDAFNAGYRVDTGSPSPALLRSEKPLYVQPFLRIENLAVAGDDKRVVGYLRAFALEPIFRGDLVADIRRVFGENRSRWEGLIIDLRGNRGGQIELAEELLCLVAGKPIEPVTVQLRNTWVNARYCQAMESMTGSQHIYRDWMDSIRSRLAEGLVYSAPLPLSDRASISRSTGALSSIPKILLVDGATASAAEVFTAGFLDNEVGEVIGTDASTAGAGTHTTTLSVLTSLGVMKEYPFDDDAGFGGLSFSLGRILRSRLSIGEPFEDKGIRPDVIVPLTRNDVLNGNEDLLLTVIARLFDGECN